MVSSVSQCTFSSVINIKQVPSVDKQGTSIYNKVKSYNKAREMIPSKPAISKSQGKRKIV